MSRMPLIAKAARVDVKRISPTQKFVLMMLAEYADAEGRCFPSVETLAADTGFSDRAVQKAIRGLVAAGFLVIEKGGGRGHSNRYRVAVKGEPSSGFNEEKGEPHSPNGVRGSAIKGEPRSLKGERRSGELPKNPPLVLEADASNTHAPPPKPDDRFAEFWSVYAHKVARGAAARAWVKAIKRAPPDRIISGAARYAATRNPQYVAHAATWLNAERWDDEPPAPHNGGTRNDRPQSRADIQRRIFERFDRLGEQIDGGIERDDCGAADEPWQAGPTGNSDVVPLLAIGRRR